MALDDPLRGQGSAQSWICSSSFSGGELASLGGFATTVAPPPPPLRSHGYGVTRGLCRTELIAARSLCSPELIATRTPSARGLYRYAKSIAMRRPSLHGLQTLCELHRYLRDAMLRGNPAPGSLFVSMAWFGTMFKMTNLDF